MTIPQNRNLRWSIDFVADTLASGRRFRILTVVDDSTRECLALVPDTLLLALRVVRELHTLIASRGRPATCVCDNGTELAGMAILRWSQETRVEWHYIAWQAAAQCLHRELHGWTGAPGDRRKADGRSPSQ